MLYDTISDNPCEIKEVINEISDNLPDDVERTARRLLRLNAWLNARDNDTCSLPLYGSYRPLRPDQNQLVLVEEGIERICDRVLPFVVSLHKPSRSDHNQTIKSRLSKELRKRTLRAVDSFTAGKFKESRRQIVATKFQTVESLQVAERIVKGEPLDVTDDSGYGRDDRPVVSQQLLTALIVALPRLEKCDLDLGLSGEINLFEGLIHNFRRRCIQVCFDGLERFPSTHVYHDTRVHLPVNDESLCEPTSKIVATHVSKVGVACLLRLLWGPLHDIPNAALSKVHPLLARSRQVRARVGV